MLNTYLKEPMRDTDPVIKLCVGGEIFFTNESTILKIPDSYLALNLEHQSHTFPFIDRDPTFFPYILNYIRGYTPCFTSGPLAEEHNQIQLLDEARFFRLNKLITSLESLLNPTGDKPSIPTLLVTLREVEKTYRAEWRTRFQLYTAQKIPESYITLEQIMSKYPINSTDPLAHDVLTFQINIRKEHIKIWREERYLNNFQKMIATIGVFLEYIAPDSPFTKNLAQQLQTRCQTDPEIRQILEETVVEYLERQDKPLSPFIRLLTSLITIIFFQGLSPTTEGEGRGGALNPINTFLENYPDLKITYEKFKQERKQN